MTPLVRRLVSALILLFIFGIAYLVHRYIGGATVYLPWGLAAIYFSIYIFWEYNRVRKAKREERREHFRERFTELTEMLGRKKGGPVPPQ